MEFNLVGKGLKIRAVVCAKKHFHKVRDQLSCRSAYSSIQQFQLNCRRPAEAAFLAFYTNEILVDNRYKWAHS
jgi:hypothetical protein